MIDDLRIPNPDPDKPWDNRKYVEPKRTYSGKVIYKRSKHVWTVKDAERILNKLVPQQPDEPFYQKVINLLKEKTIDMLQQLLPYADDKDLRIGYNIVADLLDTILGYTPDRDIAKNNARDIINKTAQLAGFEVTIKDL